MAEVALLQTSPAGLGAFTQERDVRQVGAEFGVSEATAWRYVSETIEILASWASGLHEALAGLGECDLVIVEWKPHPTDRIPANEPYDSEKHKKQDMNVQVLARPDGTSLWFSRATPGRPRTI